MLTGGWAPAQMNGPVPIMRWLDSGLSSNSRVMMYAVWLPPMVIRPSTYGVLALTMAVRGSGVSVWSYQARHAALNTERSWLAQRSNEYLTSSAVSSRPL